MFLDFDTSSGFLSEYVVLDDIGPVTIALDVLS